MYPLKRSSNTNEANAKKLKGDSGLISGTNIYDYEDKLVFLKNFCFRNSNEDSYSIFSDNKENTSKLKEEDYNKIIKEYEKLDFKIANSENEQKLIKDFFDFVEIEKKKVNFNNESNFPDNVKKHLEKLKKEIKDYFERKLNNHYYTYAIVVEDQKNRNEKPKINFGKGSGPRPFYKILLAFLFARYVENLDEIKCITQRMLVESIKSEKSIKIIILESDLLEQQSFALESIRLSWLFDQTEFTIMQKSPTSFDLKKLKNVSKIELEEIKEQLISKFKKCLIQTKEINFACYSKIIDGLVFKNSNNILYLEDKLGRLVYHHLVSSLDNKLKDLIDTVVHYAHLNDYGVSPKMLYEIASNKNVINDYLSISKYIIKCKTLRYGYIPNNKDYIFYKDSEVQKCIIDYMKEKLSKSTDKVKLNSDNYMEIQKLLKDSLKIDLKLDKIYIALTKNKYLAQIFDNEDLNNLESNGSIEDNLRNTFETFVSSFTEFSGKINDINEIEKIIEKLVENKVPIKKLNINFREYIANEKKFKKQNQHLSIQTLLTEIKDNETDFKYLLLYLNRYLANGAKNRELVKTGLALIINNKNYRLKSIICELNDSKFILLSVDYNIKDKKISYYKTLGDKNNSKVPVSACWFSNVSKKCGIVYTFEEFDDMKTINNLENFDRIELTDQIKVEKKNKINGVEKIKISTLLSPSTSKIDDVKKNKKVKVTPLKKHSTSNTQPTGKHKCPDCNYSTNKIFNLNRHIDNNHRNEKEKERYKCEVEGCTSSYTTKSKLKQHVEMKHDPNYVKKTANRVNCPYCPKDFADNSALKIHHDSVHKGTKFACEMCNSSFSQINDLKRHKKNEHNI